MNIINRVLVCAMSMIYEFMSIKIREVKISEIFLVNKSENLFKIKNLFPNLV